MNTRLQVEHPVTECITGLDLVEQMIRVAAGEKLALHAGPGPAQAAGRSSAASTPRTRSAASCRAPAGWCVPAAAADDGIGPSRPRGGVRVDTGVYEGGEIPMYYDSMIAKLIVHGRPRAAIAKMREALNGFVIRGVSSNIPFQAALLAHPKFVAGDFNTGFIAEHYPQGFSAERRAARRPRLPARARGGDQSPLLARSAGISGQLPGHERADRRGLRRRQDRREGARTATPARCECPARSSTVDVAGRRYAIVVRLALCAASAMHGTSTAGLHAQVERLGCGTASRTTARRSRPGAVAARRRAAAR
jgi:propionyl-CoA carboxylase alpha chain